MSGSRTAGADAGAALTEHLLRGLRIAQSLIVLAVLLGLALGNLLAHLDRYPSPAHGLVPYGVLLAVAVLDAVLVASRRFWGRWRLPAAAVVLATAWAAAAGLPVAELVSPADWSLGAAGWFGVVLFCDTALRHVVAFVAAHAALVATVLVAGGRTDPATWVQLALVLVAVAGFQLAVAAAGAALRAVAADAAAEAVRSAAAATREAVARQVHADRTARYADLRGSVVPLLDGLRSGALSAADPAVRRRAAREAARMRRLFAEHDDVSDPLAADLAALVDLAERRGVAVRLAVGAVPRTPPEPVRRALLDVAGEALFTAQARARVTLGSVGEDVVLAVVTDGTADPAPVDGVRVTTVGDAGSTWVEARWT